MSVSRLGKITSPPDGTRLTFLPGSTEKIQWTFDDDISLRHRGRVDLSDRSWYFTSSDGSQRERLATIYFDGEPGILNSSLPGVAIEKPATLVLKNIDLRNNGTYRFQLRIYFHFFHRRYSRRTERRKFRHRHINEENEVVVYVAGK